MKTFIPDLSPVRQEDAPWRERIFFAICLSGILAGSISFVSSTSLAIRNGYWLNVIIYVMVYSWAIIVTFGRRIPFQIRAWSVLSLFYVLGLLAILTGGPAGSGRVWLFALSVVASLVLGLGAGLATLVINGITLITLALLMDKGFVAWPPLVLSARLWMVGSATFLFLTTIVTVSLAVLVRSLEKSLKSEKKLAEDMALRNKELEQEVTERIQAEQALKESEERYRTLVDNSLTGVCVVQDGIIRFASEQFEKLSGFSQEDLLELPYINLVHPDDRDYVLQEAERRLSGKKLNPYTRHRGVNKNGDVLWLETRGATINYQGGQAILANLLDITERKRAEDELRRQKSYFQQLFESSPEAILLVDEEDKTISANNGFREMFQYSIEDIRGRSANDFIIPEHLAEEASDLTHRTLQGRVIRKESVRKRKDSSLVDVEILGYPIFVDNRMIGAYVIYRDISERKRAEHALKESEHRYRSLVDNLLCGIAIIQDGKIVFANDWLVENSGYAHEELVGNSFDIFVHPLDKELSVAAATGRFQGDMSIRPPVRVLTKNGEIRWTEALGAVIEYEGKPAILSCIIDITERMEAEKAFRESEDKYRSLFEETKDIVLITTPEGRFLDINSAGVEFYGYSSRTELLRDLLAQDTYVNPNDRKEVLGKISERGFVKDYELLLKRKDGQHRVALLTATAERDDNGTVVAYRGILRDITEAKQLQQQFFQAQKMESIGTLAGGIAHDFNNILGGVLGYASFMKSKMTEGDSFFNYVDIIEKSAMHAAELTAKLLAFARGGRYDIKPLKLNRIVDETLQIIGRTFDKSIGIQTHLQDNLPTIEADTAQLQQVLINLCLNAADAMPYGGKLIIEAACETLTEQYVRTHVGAKAGSYVRLSVSDTGMGMDEETRKRIFEPFFTTKESGKGTGLGLSMVYGVVKNHGGFVHVYSELGHGTTFRIYLPISGKPERTETSELATPVGGDELILVVDDEKRIRSLAKDMLESFGYRILTAEDGVDAVKIYAQHKDEVGLVILDMVMPKMGGRETYLKLKELNPGVSVLLSTGYSQNGKAQEILDSGVMGFIQKPYQLHTLLSKVRSILDAKG